MHYGLVVGIRDENGFTSETFCERLIFSKENFERDYLEQRIPPPSIHK
jgi:hypothetical protein